MKLEAVELRRIAMPMVARFRTAFGSLAARYVLLVRVITADGDGWGECVAMAEPTYSPEYVEGAAHVAREHLLPRVLAESDITAARVADVVGPVVGHPMAKAAVECAVLDAELRQAGIPLAQHLGSVRDRVPSGVSVGIMGSIGELLDAVDGYLAEGYVRIKLKIEPGWDIEPVQQVRERFGDDVLLQVDANAAYTLDDARHLAQLDPFDLLLIEQPLPQDDLSGHAALARQISTPVCLDESVTSARSAADAIALGACSIVNIKAGRVGGYLEAQRVHDLCAANGIAVWCGGMFETGLGRAANVALASLPNFTLPGDISASDRFFARDIVSAPFTLDDGHLRVPTGAGLGVDIDMAVLDDITTSVELVKA